MDGITGTIIAEMIRRCPHLLSLTALCREFHKYYSALVSEMSRRNDSGYEVEYYFGGLLHRNNGPAKIVRCGEETVEYYYLYGQMRDSQFGPAITRQYSGGEKIEEYIRSGELHRDFLPAHSEWFPSGRIRREIWIERGMVISTQNYDDDDNYGDYFSMIELGSWSLEDKFTDDEMEILD